jgi:antibiotic biosynthesis monooxygenase (ABM) superfamily enzyme
LGEDGDYGRPTLSDRRMVRIADILFSTSGSTRRTPRTFQEACMDDPINAGVGATEVTWVITYHVNSEHHSEFEEWVSGIELDLARFRGHRGLTVFRPGQGADSAYVLVVRFAAIEDLRRWESSPERAHWLRELAPLVAESPDYRTESGLETWFQLPGQTVVVPPPKYKGALLILLALYPLLLIVLPLLGELLGESRYLANPIRVEPEFFTSTLISATILVALMTWVAMPLLTKLFRRWL